jgi:predicted TPR repeat methyltransferase
MARWSLAARIVRGRWSGDLVALVVERWTLVRSVHVHRCNGRCPPIPTRGHVLRYLGAMDHRCRFCDTPLRHVVVDLGVSPLCESFLRADQLDEMEPFYPLRVMVCDQCFLVQLPAYVTPDVIFTEYAYFSSFSDSWIEHARRYAEEMRSSLGLGPDSLVVELGSNDGYLLRHFVDMGIPVLGIEPAQNVAAVAVDAGVPTIARFFDLELARELRAEGRRADVIAVNNVLAQIPEINGFVEGIAELLGPEGTLTIEVPHLLRLLEENQFDTIYHEHFSYFSLGTVQRILRRHGLDVVDVEELPTHGGSLRVHARHTEVAVPGPRVDALLAIERDAGLDDVASYASFGADVAELKRSVLAFLIGLHAEGKTVAGYGAPGKANTLLNYCGIGPELLPFTVDRNPYKHGRYTPGTRIPILDPSALESSRPDYIWILPWNLRTEISAQLAGARAQGTRLFVAIPGVEVLD